jgi:hypothetical protein
MTLKSRIPWICGGSATSIFTPMGDLACYEYNKKQRILHCYLRGNQLR